MPSLPKIKQLMGLVPRDPQLQGIRELYRLSDEAWEDNRFAEAMELLRLAEVHRREYLARQNELLAHRALIFDDLSQEEQL